MDDARIGPAGPVYIGGPDRCGKTTLAAFLTSHPRIAVPDVGSNMWTYFYDRYGDLAIDENFERCLDAMLSYDHVQFLDPDSERIRREFRAGPRTYPRLFASFLEHFAERAGKPRWGVQTGLIERYADPIFAAEPDAKVLHMLRDPRDRYEASLALWPDGKGRAGGAAARWRYSVRLGERHTRRYPDRYRFVRYEDLVQRPEDTLREVCAFLGEDFHPEMLGMPGAAQRRDKLIARSTERPEGSPVSTEYIGRFRGRVPPLEVKFLQVHTRGPMRRHGYAPDPVRCTAGEWVRFAFTEWPGQYARMKAWQARELIEERLPTVVRRQPSPPRPKRHSTPEQAGASA